MNRQILIKTSCIFLILNNLTLISCKKFLEIPAPTTSINEANVYKNDYTAAAVLTGIYTKIMQGFSDGGITSISLIEELASDNLGIGNLNVQADLIWWRNMVSPDYINNGGYNNYFSNLYPRIFTINAAIEGLNQSQTLTPAVKKRLLGEAYFLRAFYFFYLVNLFGDVPLVTSTDYRINSTITRSSTSAIYNHIETDLEQSKTYLNDDYVDASIIKPTTERVRPNQSTAVALQARVKLYRKKYLEAETAATTIINNKSQYDLVGLDSVFKKNSKETLWALQPVKQGYNTDEATFFILTSAPGTLSLRNYYLSPSLMSSFEDNDKRLTSWINYISANNQTYPYAFKYQADLSSSSVKEYCIVFRLAEQYLIRAESRLEQNNIEGAKEDLNAIRKRAGIPPISTNSVSALRIAINRERRVELFTEWGHRWFDLIRTNSVDSVMQNAMAFKGGTWASFKVRYPIPNTERLTNPNLTQNIGY
ncbi:SusD family protein [Chitinophaga eiseniae]|uniref:SusD family protein n=1 Tax=Chitinophaga eiseniae TaxID=634771 RepID=A0A1T4N5M3_9BACT|nr:RagB/SusD family nutrient uptake outer membrane protein [Chitinophaga eiseniae]SJZ74168.1 SusD family protein [Chitinophaga eiseniae]